MRRSGRRSATHRYRISIHAPHAGCDSSRPSLTARFHHFNPRTPCGVRPRARPCTCGPTQNFNPRTPCGVRQAVSPRVKHDMQISIHAPHAGCDRRTGCIGWPQWNFNPRTPCGVRRFRPRPRLLPNNFNPRTPCGVRLMNADHEEWRREFQSTHPMRGATRAAG